MSPSEIQPHTVSFILQYISPPSQLVDPLPPFILSKSLLQRHHFLRLSPEEPIDYLCWPSTKRSDVIERLESFVKPVDDIDYSKFLINYTSDGEHLYAHVCISSDENAVRLVFQWTEPGDWTYHDAGLMPFPSGSYSSLDALQAETREHRALSAEPLASLSQEIGSGEASDDDYWNAYDGDDDDVVRTAQPFSAENNSEDAYWAQYSSVHGSGDSTQPSPPPQPRKLPMFAESFYTNPDEPIQFSYDTLHPRTYTELDPPSPEDLAQRLHILSDRDHDDRPPSPALLSSSSDSASIGNTPSLLTEGMSSIQLTTERDTVLKQGIKSMYQLWKSGRSSQDSQDRDIFDRQDFLELVQEAVGLSS